MTNWFKSGAPWIWLNGGAVALCMIMVAGLLGLIAVRGFGHFWQADIAEIRIAAGDESRVVLGELVREETVAAAVARDAGSDIPAGVDLVKRYLIKQGNRDQTGRDFVWYLGLQMEPWQYPGNAFVVERREWGNFYGYPVALLRNGEEIAVAADADFRAQLQDSIERSLLLHERIQRIEKAEIGSINSAMERLRLDGKLLDLEQVSGIARAQEEERIASESAALEREYQIQRREMDQLYEDTRLDTLRMRMSDGSEVDISLASIVRVTAPNSMSVLQKAGQYFERLWEFLSEDPREANTEGGIFPAIFGTVLMTIIMAVIVTPFGTKSRCSSRNCVTNGTLTAAATDGMPSAARTGLRAVSARVPAETPP